MPQKLTMKSWAFAYAHDKVNNENHSTDVHETIHLVYVSTRDSTSVPGYRSLIKRGLSATSLFSDSMLIEQQYKPSNVVFVNRGGVTIFSDGLHSNSGYLFSSSPSPGASFGLIDNTANSNALTQFLKKVIKERDQAQGLVILGELRQTIAMMRKPLQGLKSVISDHFGRLRKGVRLTRKDRIKLLADSWLEVVFGWIPFASDVSDVVKSIQRLSSNIKRTPLHGVGTESSASSSVTVEVVEDPVSFTVTRDDLTECMVIYRGSMKEGVTAENNSRIGSILGLELPSVVPAIWELVPWSFLIDYFSNIGDLVSAPFSGYSDLSWVNRTIRWTDTVRLNGVLNPIPPNADLDLKSGVIGNGEWQYKKFERAPLEVASLLSNLRFVVQIPSALQWANISALVASGKLLATQYARR